MYCVIDTTTDPFWNLAEEEYLLKSINKPVFRLWRNEPSVIIGRNQNALAEIDSDYVRSNGIKVVRRLTGGGAVFHDLGNVNFTFVDAAVAGEDTSAMFRRFTAPILSALRNLGVDARLEGRNDLVIDSRKFSGNAVCIHRGRILQHGTLLFSASMNNLAGALRAREEKFTGRAVKSNRSRVTNISEHLPEKMSVEQFISYLSETIGRECTPYKFTEKDIKAIECLAREKYSTDEWNYGKSPKYTFSKCQKFPSGMIEVYLNVEQGIIRSAQIFGDYFFRRPTKEVCDALCGCPHDKKQIAGRLSLLASDDYFCGITPEELLQLF
ncbi:MAG: lipoate--protein ligase [Bacteroidales bacterium]|nr:lipoate--protein ligase [Candidatus Cacconaster merdequi]